MRTPSSIVGGSLALCVLLLALGSATALCAEVTLVPSSETIGAGELVTVAVEVSNAAGLRGYQLDFKYWKKFGKLIKVEEGPFLKSGGTGTFCVPPKTQGRKNEPVVTLACARIGPGAGASGSGTLAVLTFQGTEKSRKGKPIKNLKGMLVKKSVILVEDD